MYPPKYHAQLTGTSKGKEIIHFSCEQHRETASRIAKEFAFEFIPFDGGANRSTFYEYPHQFRVYCSKERYEINQGLRDKI